MKPHGRVSIVLREAGRWVSHWRSDRVVVKEVSEDVKLTLWIKRSTGADLMQVHRRLLGRRCSGNGALGAKRV